MAVQVRVPTPLRRFTAGAGEVQADGTSISQVIEDLERRHPGIRERLLDEKGDIRRFVNIYLNGDDIRFLESLNSKVKDGDDVSIVPAIAGGN
jgi:sulfur-carrier protein